MSHILKSRGSFIGTLWTKWEHLTTRKPRVLNVLSCIGVHISLVLGGKWEWSIEKYSGRNRGDYSGLALFSGSPRSTK